MSKGIKKSALSVTQQKGNRWASKGQVRMVADVLPALAEKFEECSEITKEEIRKPSWEKAVVWLLSDPSFKEYLKAAKVKYLQSEAQSEVRSMRKG